MTTSERILETLKYVLITVLTFAALQTVLVVMHEFTHSTVAWALGHMQSPLEIVWGNPLTLKGWDEGVDYSQIYASGQFHAAAIIGFCPMILHAVIVTLGLVLLQREWMKGKKWLFHFLFWFVIANFMEIISYITMGSFCTGGDVYHFNHGLGLSPWILFIVGSLAIAVGLYFLFRDVLPRMYAIFAQGNHMNQWAILLMTVIILFLWGSGLRVAISVYPNPQWMFGFLDFAALVVVLITCNPTRAWIVSRIKME
jgi:hypothetical protein